MSHRAAELERQLWYPNPTDFPRVAERPKTAHLAHSRAPRRRSPFRSHSRRSAGAAGTGQSAPKPSFFSPGRGRPLSGGKLSFISRLYLPEVCQLPTSGEPPLTTPVRHHSGGWPGSAAPRAWSTLPANRSAALAGHEHHTFKDRGEVAGGAYNHKTMPDWRVKRHRSMMNRRADHIERKAGENEPHCRRRHGH